MAKRLTFAAVREELRGLGVTIHTTAVHTPLSPEYRVALAGVPRSQGGGSYYTDDLEDALATGRDMTRRFAVRHPVREAVRA